MEHGPCALSLEHLAESSCLLDLAPLAQYTDAKPCGTRVD